MSYLWHLDGLSMALGIGELDGCTRSWNTKCHSIFFWTRIIRITRMFFGTRISLSRILSLRLVVNDSSLWLLARCGCWLIVVIGLLWLLTCCVLNDKSKKISVSHAKHWQIREICEIRVRNKYIRAIRSSCERTAANKDLWDPCA